MNKVLGLLGENKKTLFKYAEDNKIEYYKLKKNVYCFNIIFLNVEYKCKLHIYDNIINSIQLFASNEKNTNKFDLNDLVNICKDFFSIQFGSPISDNTNHPTDHIWIIYNNDKCCIHISGINQTEFSISRFDKKAAAKINIFNHATTYMLYLAGGLLWGTLMFFAVSYKDYSWTNFGIWLSGGLIWALFFGLTIEKINNFAPKQAKIKLKQISKIEENEKDLEYEISSSGQVFFLQNNKSKVYTAKFYLNNSLFIILYYKKGKIYKVVENIGLLAENLGFEHLFFKMDNQSISFNLYNREEFKNIKKYLDEKLGYHSSKFIGIYSLVKKIIEEYNPYSLYNENNKTVFDYEIDIISRRIFEKENMNPDELKEVVMIAFDYDQSPQIYEELPMILYDSIFN